MNYRYNDCSFTESIIKDLAMSTTFTSRERPSAEVGLKRHSICHTLYCITLYLYRIHCEYPPLSPSELYEYCLNEGYADRNLIAKWKKVSFQPNMLTSFLDYGPAMTAV